MTYEEALNFNQTWTPIQARNDLERYLLRNEPCAYKAIAVAMQALEKQIPSKPIKDPANSVDFQNFLCPSCKNKIVSKLDGEWIAGKLQSFCDNCGQAIDWSDA